MNKTNSDEWYVGNVSRADSHTGSWNDIHWSLEAESVPYPLQASGLQPEEHISTVHGGMWTFTHFWNETFHIKINN